MEWERIVLQKKTKTFNIDPEINAEIRKIKKEQVCRSISIDIEERARSEEHCIDTEDHCIDVEEH